MTTTEITQVPAPFPPTGIIYQYHARSWLDGIWLDIESQGHLDEIVELPDVYVVRMLHEMPIYDLLRAPAATVSSAVTTIAQARRDRDVISGQLRRALAALEGMP